MNTQGLQSTGQMANTINTTGQQIGQQNTNAAAATASGYVGAGNAYGGMASGVGNSLSQMMMLNSLFGGSGSGSGSGGSQSGINNMFNLDYMG